MKYLSNQARNFSCLRSATLDCRCLSRRGGRGLIAGNRNDRTGSTALVRAVLFEAPPFNFSLRGSVADTSRSLVELHCPDLLDLVDDGSLVAVPRSADYRERRVDGYQEPEVIFLLGTAHLSQRSALDTARVIKAVRPDKVVVELCKSRAPMMWAPERTSGDGQGQNGGDNSTNLAALGGENLFSAVQRTVELGGVPALGMRLLLGGLSRGLEKAVGQRSGQEFKEAWLGAQSLGVEVVLGDRPVEITLKRALSSLTWQRRLSFAWDLGKDVLKMPTELSQEMIDAMMDDDAISSFYARLSQSYPEVASALIGERDLYLAWSLQRSKAVNGVQRVVGIVGRGHLRGIIYHLTTNCGGNTVRFRDLVGDRSQRQSASNASRVGGILKRVAIDSAVAGGLYAAWLQFAPNFS